LQVVKESKVSEANKVQIGGDHYKKGGEEHWDRAFRLRYDPFQYIITKWIERWRDKGGIEDLEKARHAIDKYIEVIRADYPHDTYRRQSDPLRGPAAPGEGPDRGYVDQDSRC
jgi:hypothetical protein